MKTSLAILITALCFALPSMLFAQGSMSNCAEIELLSERLAGKYGESVQTFGTAANGATVNLWANTNTGSWTITVIPPATTTMCLVASGMNYEATPSDPAFMGDNI